MIKVIGKNVLVEETLTRKSSGIQLLNEDANDENVYTSKMVIIDIGPEGVGFSRNLSIGAKPIIIHYAEPLATVVIEGKAGDEKIVRHLIYSLEHVVGINNDE